MNPISNNPTAPPVTTSTTPAPQTGTPTGGTVSSQQIPQTSGLPDSADAHFDFPNLTNPNLDSLNSESLLLSLAISLEKTGLASAKQELRDHLDAVKRYADAQVTYRNLGVDSRQRLNQANTAISAFTTDVQNDRSAAQDEKDVAAQKVANLENQPLTPAVQNQLATARAEFFAADQKIAAANNILSSMGSSPLSQDRMRLTAMVLDGLDLSAAERKQVLSAASTGSEIPAALIGQLAGPDGQAAAEKANRGIDELKNIPSTIQGAGIAFKFGGNATIYAAIVDGGSLKHPAETLFQNMKIPDGPELVLGKILSALYRSNEVNKDTEDIIDQIAATVDIVGQRFSGREEVDEDVQLNFRNKMTI